MEIALLCGDVSTEKPAAPAAAPAAATAANAAATSTRLCANDCGRTIAGDKQLCEKCLPLVARAEGMKSLFASRVISRENFRVVPVGAEHVVAAQPAPHIQVI
jgi:hypothetical protein